MERNAGNGIIGVRLSEICHDNALSFKGLDIRSRPLTFQWVGKRKKRGPEHGLEFRGNGHEREVDPWRYRALACNLVRARRYRNHNPPFEVRCSAPALVVYQGHASAVHYPIRKVR